MKSIFVLILILLSSLLNAANLLHEFNFNGNLTDQIGNPTLNPIHTATSGFNAGVWNWTASSTPGGGLLLGSQLPDNNKYTIRIVFKYSVLNPTWSKIISFTGLSNIQSGYFADDYGVYFSGPYLGFYNYTFNNVITHSPNTWYDLVVTRNASNVVCIYMAPFGQQPVLLQQLNDPTGLGKPSRLSTAPGSLSYFGLFYDDTHTTAEWTAGGSVSQIQVWDDAIIPAETITPIIAHVGNEIQLNWNTLISAQSYNVYASDNPIAGWVLLGNSVTPGFSTTASEQRRFYQIRAVIN